MTALPIINDNTWHRMSWRARQQWLTTANTVRKQLLADINRHAATATPHATASNPLGVYVEASRILEHLHDDGHGPARLAAATREAWDLPEPAKPAARNARRLTIDAIETALQADPHATSQILAFQFKVTPDGIRKACKRHHRFDLLARLRENSARAAA